MTESTDDNHSKLRKRNLNEKNNHTVTNRSFIGANWQKFLASDLMQEATARPAQEVGKQQQFNGTFRKTRKQKLKEYNISNTTQNNLNSLKITSEMGNAGTDDECKNMNKKKNNTLTKFIAMDCEMVGIGQDGNDHMLARISLVNKFGDCVYDKFVKAREPVTDYRTSVSGIRREDMLNGEEFSVVQKEVAEILKGKILVGHSLKNDLGVLYLSHPKKCIRDTSKYKPFKKITKGSTPSLKRLAKEILGIDIQSGEHSSIEDAKAAMQIYCTVAKEWEHKLDGKFGHGHRGSEESKSHL